MALVEAPKRSKDDRKAADAVIATLAARYGNRLVTSQAVREQHGHTTTWIENQPPDAVVFPQNIAARLAEMKAAHASLPVPDGVGRRIAMPERG